MPTSSQSVNEPMNDLERGAANLEHWKNSALFQATGALIGDIDHVVQDGSDFIVRAWLLRIKDHPFPIALKLGKAVVSPIVRGDERDDVAQAFPQIPGAKDSGLIFLFERCAPSDLPLRFFWCIHNASMKPFEIPLDPKEPLDSSNLYHH